MNRRETPPHPDLGASLRKAFDGAPDLQPSPEFLHRLRSDLRAVPVHRYRSSTFSRQWLAIAASLLFAAGLTAAVLLPRRAAPASAALAQDAIGDHQNCALKFRLARMPIPLEEAARRFDDDAFRLLLMVPADRIATPGGAVRVVERHSCVYANRRFGHVVLQYGNHVVSLLVTENGAPADAASTATAVPHVIGRPMNGLNVVSIDASRHTVLLVGDLGSAELTQLSRAVSLPLAQRLAEGFIADRDRMASLYPAHGAAPPE